MLKHVLVFTLLIILPFNGFAQGTGGGEAYPDLETSGEALERWQDLKFGMFVHWGPVSLRGTEIGWSRGKIIPIEEYDNLYKEFNPVLFDAQEWVTTLKNAGMKYLVITTKHHDGFCLWPSDYTEYDIASTPFRRDILKELAEACEQQGIVFGTYYSIADWYHPHYTTRYGGDPKPLENSDMDVYVDYLHNQVRELIETYNTDILWFDGHWEASWTHQYGMDLYKFIRDLKDEILINNRVDKGRGHENGMTKSQAYAGDFGTPEQKIGSFYPDDAWESCITIGHQWAWKPNDHLKTAGECIQTLARTAGGGGNLLLNVGPMLDGRIEQRQIDRLAAMGDWLDQNGESIYGTQGGPFKPNYWMASTHKGKKIFIHLFKWPEQKLIIPKLKSCKITTARVLNNNQELSFEENDTSTVIFLPSEKIDPHNTVITLELDKKADLIDPLDMVRQTFSGIADAKLVLKEPFSSKYPANGLASLTDEIRGSLSYTDQDWMGFEKVDLELILDFGREKILEKVGIGCLQDQGAWIFFPSAIEVLVSDDNEHFKLAGEKRLPQVQEDITIKKTDFIVELDPISAQYFKIIVRNQGHCPEWHKGAGGAAWLFVDEIFIE